MKRKIQITESDICKMVAHSIRRVLKESLNELSPELLTRAKKAYQGKYGETGYKDDDWGNFVDREHYKNGKSYKDIFDQKPEWEKKRKENGVKSDPYDTRTYRLKKNGEKDYIAGHLKNFDNAISNSIHSPENSGYLERLTAGLDPLTAAAVKIYYPGDLDWDAPETLDDYEHGYGLYGDYAEAEDEKGRVWKFYREYEGHNEGGSIEVDDIEDITFESPDGKEGSIPEKFWSQDY